MARKNKNAQKRFVGHDWVAWHQRRLNKIRNGGVLHNKFDDYDHETRASLETSRSFKKIDGESPPWEG